MTNFRRDPDFRQARNLPVHHHVSFAVDNGICLTLEGPVPYNKRDAIVTGVSGERWPVNPQTFALRYEAVLPTVFGQDGTYRKKIMRVWVKQMKQAFDAPVADGNTSLTGQSGDWLVQYPNGEFGVIAAHLFAKIYELIDG